MRLTLEEIVEPLLRVRVIAGIIRALLDGSPAGCDDVPDDVTPSLDLPYQADAGFIRRPEDHALDFRENTWAQN